MCRICVVVATYKRDKSLEKTLESLSKQTYKDFEIILVDDNADEKFSLNVSRIISNFKKENPDIDFNYIVNLSNKGSAETRNIGIRESTGEFITFLDDDDVYLPDKLFKQVNYMIENNFDFCVTDLELYNEKGKLIDKRTRDYIKDTSPDAMMKYHLKYHITGTDTMMFKREYLNKIGGFAPINVGDEFYLMQRAIKYGGKFGYLPECDVMAYVHTGESGLSSGKSKIDGENALYQYKKTFFDFISASDRRYIKMRHFAVLAFAELRCKRYFKFIKNAIVSVLIDPVSCLTLLISNKRNY